MAHALYAFDDREAARAFAERLRASGVPDAAIRLHTDKEDAATEPRPNAVDELVSGGAFTNLVDMLQGIFDWPGPGEDREAWIDAVGARGAVVVVDADDAAQQQRVGELAQAAGCRRHTGWHSAHSSAG